MSFMQKQIYQGGYFEIDTTHGIEIVPSDVIGRTVSTDVSAFLDYLEGKPLVDDELIEYQYGWLGRLSAPGYLDCTAWIADGSEREVNALLNEMYDAYPKYEYCINLFERGEFYADVRDESGKTVYEICSNEDGEIEQIVDGFMTSVEDVEGLESYLKDIGIIESDAELTKAN